ncbi:unnamed protein product [Albugo candida]|uniref:Uncharacterized protein n=1 Tax=Albugo candida TaxID=65357 RepID=A0A024FYK2_9STRA|nr:unnamed protein product [Albugo candida]|eukprot:CCI11749.1 unnamed protein product [Albugo candida]
MVKRRLTSLGRLRYILVDPSQMRKTEAVNISLDVSTDEDPTLTLTLKGLNH